MKKNHDLVDIAAILVTETEKAYLLDTGTTKDWVPKSVTEDNQDGTYTMPYRIAHDKGFI